MNPFSEALDNRFDGSENINPDRPAPWYRSQIKEGRELLYALFLNDAGEPIEHRLIGQYCGCRIAYSPDDVPGAASQINAAKVIIIIIHTYPGDTEHEDIAQQISEHLGTTPTQLQDYILLKTEHTHSMRDTNDDPF